ncbi:MAG: hypothetical protein ACI33S_06820 [Bacilli bacterium]
MKIVVIESKKDLDSIRNIDDDRILLFFVKDIKFDGEFEPINKENCEIIIFGNNCTLENIVINKPNTNDIGLFSKVKSMNVRDLKILNSHIKSGEVCGSLVGRVDNSIKAKNVTVYANIDSDSIIGGIVGSTRTANISNCSISGNFSARGIIGGLIGICNSFEGNKNNIDSFSFNTDPNYTTCTIHLDVGYLSEREEKNLTMKLIPLMKDTTLSEYYIK